MHYSAGVSAVASFVGASLLPQDGVALTLARVLLDIAGSLFGLYLLLCLALWLYGVVLRRDVAPRLAADAGGARGPDDVRVDLRARVAEPGGSVRGSEAA